MNDVTWPLALVEPDDIRNSGSATARRDGAREHRERRVFS
jgi:hypothetical protein